MLAESVPVFGRSVSGIFEVVGAFVGLDGCDEVADMSPGVLEAPFPGVAHRVVDPGECLFDGDLRSGEHLGRNHRRAPAALIPSMKTGRCGARRPCQAFQRRRRRTTSARLRSRPISAGAALALRTAGPSGERSASRKLQSRDPAKRLACLMDQGARSHAVEPPNHGPRTMPGSSLRAQRPEGPRSLATDHKALALRSRPVTRPIVRERRLP